MAGRGKARTCAETGAYLVPAKASNEQSIAPLETDLALEDELPLFSLLESKTTHNR